MKRSVEKLATKGRPLSQKEGVAALYEKRIPMYTRFADLVVENAGTPDETVEEIIKGSP